MPLSGLYPGHTSFQAATLGYGFIEIVVTVSPGGSGLEVYDITDSRKVVTVIVRFKGNEWKQSMLIETIVIDKVIQVLSSIRSIVKSATKVVARVRDEIKGIVVTVRHYK